MRVARGRVVGNTVVLEEPLPDGAEVEVRMPEAGEEATCDVSDSEWAELLHAAAQVRRGEVVSAESVLSKLRARR